MNNVESESSAWARSAKTCAVFLVWPAVALMCTSCSHAPSMRYYTLAMSPPVAAGDPKTSFILGVEPFRGPDILRDDRILYYQSPTQLGCYQQHRWVTDPATMLQELTQRRLRQTGVFAQVRLAPFREPVDYVLKGRVLSLEEVDYPSGVQGRVGLELSLLRARDRKVVWSAQRQVDHAVREQGVGGVVNALDDATKQILEGMTQAIVAQVESDYRASKDKTTQ